MIREEILLFFGKHKKVREQQRLEKIRERYVQRLVAIDSMSPGTGSLAPSAWNIGLGQADFLGNVHKGRFENFYVVVEVQGMPTQEDLREDGARWWEYSEPEMLQTVTGFWGTFVRRSQDQPDIEAADREFEFATLPELQEFLNTMDVTWHPARESLDYLDGEFYLSNDWNCGDAPRGVTPEVNFD